MQRRSWRGKQRRKRGRKSRLSDHGDKEFKRWLGRGGAARQEGGAALVCACVVVVRQCKYIRGGLALISNASVQKVGIEGGGIHGNVHQRCKQVCCDSNHNHQFLNREEGWGEVKRECVRARV